MSPTSVMRKEYNFQTSEYKLLYINCCQYSQKKLIPININASSFFLNNYMYVEKKTIAMNLNEDIVQSGPEIMTDSV